MQAYLGVVKSRASQLATQGISKDLHEAVVTIIYSAPRLEAEDLMGVSEQLTILQTAEMKQGLFYEPHLYVNKDVFSVINPKARHQGEVGLRLVKIAREHNI